FELWAALLHGARLVVLRAGAASVDDYAAVLRDHRVTTLWLTAALFHLFVDERPEALAPVTQLLAGGDVLSPPHVRRLLAARPDLVLINGYGPTENTTFSCCHRMQRTLAETSVPIGRPIGHSRAYVLDGALAPAVVGVTGELYVAGDGLARGYL